MNTFFSFQQIYWREPLWLLLSAQPFIIILINKLIRNNNLSSYADINLHPWIVFPNHYKLTNFILSKNAIYIVAWLLFSISLAGPRTPLTQDDKKQLFGANIMLVVDLSQSMTATDVSPNRLRRVNIEIHELLEKAQDHRIGITVFSARPHLFVPLTSDHNTLKIYLEAIGDLSFPTMGSDPISAILFAQKELLKQKGKSAIILLTDGDFTTTTKEEIKQLQLIDIPLYILGIGSVEGEAVQTKDGKWLKYKEENVISRMNENNLKKLASSLNGRYSPVYDDDTDWKSLYDQGISKHSILSNNNSKQHIVWKELFPYFLFPSILFFWFSLSHYKLKWINDKSYLIVLFFLVFALPENNAQAFEINIEFGQTSEQTAYRAYTSERYNEANKIYQNISGYIGHIGQGNSLYQLGHYQKSTTLFISAALSAQNNSQRAKALYNLANSYFRTGKFSLAIATYEDVLLYQPNNVACSYNIKVSKILKENIEKRLKARAEIISSPSSQRQGRGPRSASLTEGTEIAENTSVSMDGSESKLNNGIPLPELPNFDEDQVARLIQSGINNITLVKQGSSTGNKTSHNNNSNISLLNAQQQINIMSDNQHLLWKRLFEIEEGFPAPVDKPKSISGVRPW